VELELVWETDGTPYQWRQTTHYEIPCRVRGAVRVGDEKLKLEGPGQRDHSWGKRDWWTADWMWSAGRLDDRTAFHAVHVRFHGGPEVGVGYVQQPDGTLIELERVSAAEQVRDDGLVAGAQLELSPPTLSLEVHPLAFTPLRLTADNGRSTRFPRAMCRVVAKDGRRGLAWVEWNLNDRPANA